jgi:hypothetical protein
VTGWGRVGAGKQAVDGNEPDGGHGCISVGEIRLCLGVKRESHWMVEIKILFIMWLSPFLKLV